MNLFYPLLGLGLLTEAGYLLLTIQNNLSDQSGLYVCAFAVLFVFFGLASYLVLRIRPAGESENKPPGITGSAATLSGKGPHRTAVLVLIIYFAALFRLTTIFVAPTLSTDQFRYTWEGRLVTLGISPYQYAPDSPALLPYHSEIWPLVQQKETASPYPPLAQLTGAIEYTLLGDSLFGPKIAAALFDFLTCLALLWLLGIFRMDLRRVILYAWCPLPIIEFGQSGHNDSLMLLLMVLAVGLALKNHPALSAITLGLACLAKFTPLFGLPLFLIVWEGSSYTTLSGGKKLSGWGWRVMQNPRSWRYPLLTLAVVVAGYVPFLILGRGAIGSIFEYTGTWRDNDSLIYQGAFLLGGIYAAKAASLLILGITILILSFHPRLASELSLPRRLMLVLGVTLLVASTVHSSYASWLLVWLPLVLGSRFKGWDRGWLLFAVLIQFYYLNYSPKPDFPVRGLINPFEYWPLHLFIAWNIYTWWRDRRTKPSSITLKEPYSELSGEN